jgi:predicted RNA binding protein YcfA (HicA-like mRNA interferase family)
MGRKLPQVPGNRVCRALERGGLPFLYSEGSHRYYRGRSGIKLAVPVHGSAVVKPGTLRRILTDAGIDLDEFLNLL